MTKLDLAGIPDLGGTGDPEPFRAEVAGRTARRLASAGGLSQFGVNFVTL